MEQEIRYCTTADGITIAYAVSGRGQQRLLHTSNDLCATLQYQTRGQRAWIDALGEHFTVVHYDSRGTGLSQRECEDLSLTALAIDVAAVVDATGLEPVALYGHLGGTFAAALYAAQRPEMVRRLILWPPPILDLTDPRNATLGRLAVTDWETFTETYAHIALGWSRGEESHQFAVAMRATVTRETWIRFMRQFGEPSGEPTNEFYGALAHITVPTLVIQRSSYSEFSRIASLVQGSCTTMFEGDTVGPSMDATQMQHVVNAIADFADVTRAIPTHPVDLPDKATFTRRPGTHGTAVILFTDIVDSTGLTERLGDATFRTSSRLLDSATRDAIQAAGGEVVVGKVLGDGVMGVFTSATEAIDAARRCLEMSANSELRLHIGLHAGDVIREDQNVYGGAVNIAARICGICEPGEILVSATVRDLARTSAA